MKIKKTRLQEVDKLVQERMEADRKERKKKYPITLSQWP